LICEMNQSFLFMSEVRDIKLSKNGSEFYVTLPASKKDSIREACNKFVSTLKLNTITYRCSDNEPESIKQSNECLAEKRFNELSKEYNKEKLDYLKSLLKSNIK
jgi:pyrimidine deaminase RibD-like protein